MRDRSRNLAALILIAVMSLGLTTGCGTFSKLGGLFGNIFSPNRHNDFSEANLRIKAREADYTKHRLMVVDESGNPREGVLTIAQYRKFQALEQNVIDATKPLYDKEANTGDIIEWRRTNTKPVSYEGHERTLFTAIDELIAFVKREAVKL